MKRGDFPLLRNCDLDKPEEAFAWTMVALPRMNGAALPMSSEYIQLVSKHLWTCGARIPHTREGKPKYQQHKYIPPSAGDPHWLTNPGRWGPMDTPEPKQADMVTVLEAMKKADEGGFFNALNKVMRENG